MSLKLKYFHKINKQIVIADMISALLIVLFLYAALSKLWAYESFKSVLIMSPLLRPFAGIIARLLPILEIGIVLLLFFPKTRVKGLYTALIILTVFTGYITYMIIFTPRLICNCGGVLKSLTWTQHIFFNLFWILLTVAAIALYQQIKKAITTVPP